MPAERLDGRHLGLAQDIEGAGQQHGDRPRLGHGDGAIFVGVFEVVRRQRLELGGEPRAVKVGKLIGMQLHRQAQRLGLGENPTHFVRRERDAFDKTVNGIGKLGPRHRRQDRVGYEPQIARAVARIFGRQGVGRKAGGGDRDRAVLGEAARHFQHAQFARQVEPVAGFDFDGGDAFGHQRIEPPQGCRRQFGIACRSRCLDA